MAGTEPAGRGPRPSLRRSLLFKLLASSLLIVVCAISATAWLAVRTTTSAVLRQTGQVLTDDNTIYDTLMSYAASHPDWSRAGPTVRDLARRTGRRILLTDQEEGHRRLAGSTSGPPARPSRAFAVIDPLHTAPRLPSGSGSGRIAPQALGPYRLTGPERARLGTEANAVARCLADRHHLAFTRTVTSSGRPVIRLVKDSTPASMLPGADPQHTKMTQDCRLSALDRPTSTEARALAALNDLVSPCLRRRHLPSVRIGLDFRAPAPVGDSPQAQDCVDAARREQLASYVSPAALLYVSDHSAATVVGLDLSRNNTLRILGVTALVLLISAAVTVLTGTRLTRPLRALTHAVQTPGTGDPVPVTSRDEVGRLTAAFNDLSAQRAHTEQQRKEMVSDIAHELRTPLSTIRSALEATQDELITADGQLIDSLLKEALLLQHIIDDLQDLAAADAGTLRLHREPIEVDAILAQVTAAHRTAAETAGVELSARAEPCPVTNTDPLRLRQVVANLVSNAVRHTPPGGRVTIESRHDKGAVVIEVSDTGSGIAPQDLPFVFDRFWRAEKSRNRRTGGSGLGLSIARKLTEAHGGTLSADSRPGIGSRFTVRLPL